MKNPFSVIDFSVVDSSQDCNSVIRSSLIARGKDSKEGRQIVFFTSVDPMSERQEDEPYDVTESREELYRTKWKVCQKAR